jgi:triphosphoribosyl-dephospho-CoA synthetase
MENGGMYTDLGRESIEGLDQKYIQSNISPGGSADLLAVTYFLYAIEQRLNRECLAKQLD